MCGGKFFDGGVVGGEIGGFGLEQERREIRESRFGVVAFLVEAIECGEQFGQGIGVVEFGERREGILAVFGIESLSFQPGEENGFFARGADQFLVGEPIEDVGRGARTIGNVDFCFGILRHEGLTEEAG